MTQATLPIEVKYGRKPLPPEPKILCDCGHVREDGKHKQYKTVIRKPDGSFFTFDDLPCSGKYPNGRRFNYSYGDLKREWQTRLMNLEVGEHHWTMCHGCYGEHQLKMIVERGYGKMFLDAYKDKLHLEHGRTGTKFKITGSIKNKHNWWCCTRYDFDFIMPDDPYVWYGRGIVGMYNHGSGSANVKRTLKLREEFKNESKTILLTA